MLHLLTGGFVRTPDLRHGEMLRIKPMSAFGNAGAKSEASCERQLWADFVEKGLLIRPDLADSISLIRGGIGHDGGASGASEQPVLAYETDDDTITILAVLHSARRWPNWF